MKVVPIQEHEILSLRALVPQARTNLGGKTVFPTNPPVETPSLPFDNDDHGSLIENCCIKATKQQWDLSRRGTE
ncbi:MAG TPA: hypothetical protein VLK82_18535 [Candidatus Tectomicrobia bacterium]|nr:hypothetical protein [Candidatus Tectomicrobia bacterium]